MKISNDISSSIAATEKSTIKAAGHSNKTHPTTTAVGSVSISDASRALQTSGASNVEAPFDAKRVDAIKAAISSGQFKVNAEKVADKVIDSASQLLTGKA